MLHRLALGDTRVFFYDHTDCLGAPRFDAHELICVYSLNQ
jgi:hypothetical protein